MLLDDLVKKMKVLRCSLQRDPKEDKLQTVERSGARLLLKGFL